MVLSLKAIKVSLAKKVSIFPEGVLPGAGTGDVGVIIFSGAFVQLIQVTIQRRIEMYIILPGLYLKIFVFPIVPFYSIPESRFLGDKKTNNIHT